MPRVAFYNEDRTNAQTFIADFIDRRTGTYAPNQPARRQRLKELILRQLTSNSGSVVIDSMYNVPRYYGETVIESSIPSYEPLITEHKVKDLPSNTPFDKRKRAGEVVLSAAEHGSVIVKSYPGFEKTNYAYMTTGHYVDRYFCAAQLGYEEVRLWGSTFLVDPDDSNVIISNVGMNTYYDVWNHIVAKPPIPLTASAVYASVRNSNEVDTSFVTGIVADANKRLLDLLTTLAEAPESLRSFMQLMGSVKNIVVGVKKRQFSLTQSFRDREKFLERKRNEDLFKLNIMREDLEDQVSKKVLTRRLANRRKKQLMREQERMLKTYERAKRQAGIELVDALAHVWMNYRYNIMPLVYTAIDITEAVTKDPEFLTTRDTLQQEVSLILPSDLPALEFTTDFKVFIRDRAKADIGPFSITSKVVSGNILTTAWELIPLSFVVDWFVNVGDFISAFSGGSTADRNSTISFKSVLDYTGKDSFDRKVVITGQLWNRQVTGSLLQHSCLTFKPDMNPKRYLDSVALSWNAIRGDLIRSIKRS